VHTLGLVEYEWDPAKARANLSKHGVSFADAALALEDELALTIRDDQAEGEVRFVTMGVDPLGRLLVVSPHKAFPRNQDRFRTQGNSTGAPSLRGGSMRKQYDFSKAKRGAVVAATSGKTRITIRLDDDVLAWFRSQVEDAGGGSYQSLINAALRDYMQQRGSELEETLRRVIREELEHAS